MKWFEHAEKKKAADAEAARLAAASLASKLDKNAAETVTGNVTFSGMTTLPATVFVGANSLSSLLASKLDAQLDKGLMGVKYSGYTHQDPTAIYNFPMLGSPRRYARLYLQVDEGSDYTYAFWGYIYHEDPNFVRWEFRIQFDDTAELYINDSLVVGSLHNDPESLPNRSTESNDPPPGLYLAPHTYHKINIYYSEGAGTSNHAGQFRFWYRAGLHSADENDWNDDLTSSYYNAITPFRCFNVWPFLASHEGGV